MTKEIKFKDRMLNKVSIGEMSSGTFSLFNRLLDYNYYGTVYYVDMHTFHRNDGTVGNVKSYMFNTTTLPEMKEEMLDLIGDSDEIYVYEVGEINKESGINYYIRMEII